MNDYNTSIVITSVMRFNSKKGEPGTKVDLLLTDPTLCGVNDKFIGCTPVTQWYNGHDVFDIIAKQGLILKGIEGHFVSRKDFKDPTKFVSRLESVTYKDNVITLLQPNK